MLPWFRLLLAAAIMACFARAAAAQEYDTDRPGGDYKTLRLSAPDFNLCRALCAKDEACVAWSYERPDDEGGRARCRLKSEASKRVSDECCVSGVKQVAAEDSEDRCRDYATKAVSQNDENLRKRCGYRGDDWQSNRRTHFDWCMSVSSRQARRAQDGRDKQLGDCGGGASGEIDETDCRTYAEKASAAAKEAERLGCGYSGDRWTRVYTRHYNWCRLAGGRERRSEEKSRDAQLEKCRIDQAGGDDEGDRCQTYAEEAVQQQAENKKLNCNLEGVPRWSQRLSRHVDFCQDATREELKSESQARRQALRQCREQANDGNSDKSEACREYADSAAGQQAENKRLGCDYKGEEWRSSTAVHYEWCMQNNRADRQTLFVSRQRDLKRCKEDSAGGGGGGGPECSDYAEQAVGFSRENRKLGCGFSGGRWSGDDDSHADWCRTASPRARAKEMKIREQLLGICKGNAERAGDCRKFSNLAIEHQQFNLARGCGFTGPRWNSSYEEHFVFCMGLKRTVRNIEAFARNTALLSCR